MRVLLCHNYYQQRGGEDQCFEDEGALLESHGHEVVRYVRHNDDVADMSSWNVARDTLWSRRSYRELREILVRHRPHVMHCTNTFPLISPSAYYAARDERVPVVQALHNYRALCPKAQFLRDGRVCEDCLLRRVPWPAIVHKCYREDRKASTVVTALIAWQRLSRVWHKLVTRFYTLSDFAKDKLIEGGLPGERIDIKPNFVSPVPRVGTGSGQYAVFVGRLSPEKGLTTLLDAWSTLGEAIPLRIVGDGPLADRVREAAAADPRIEWLGHQPLEDVCRIVADASCLVMPSVWYETFGRTIIEAYSVGTPVLVSQMGAMAELVHEGRTGLLFNPGDPLDLIDKLKQMLAHSTRLTEMRQSARAEFDDKYTVEANYRQLVEIYRRAIDPTSPGDSSNDIDTTKQPCEVADEIH